MKKRFSWQRLAVLGVGLLAAGVVSFALGGGSSSARGDHRDNNEVKYYLTLNGVDGEVDEDQHKDAIKLSSYRFLENQPDVEPMADNGGDVAFGDNNLRFQAEASKATPMLFAMATTGQQVPEATLTVHKGWDHDYMTFKMTNLQVTSYQNNSNEEHPPLDEVVLSFETLEVSHNQDEHKSFKKGWNFRDKKPF
jgi:type VI protein secretion system component Hcp